MFYKRDANLLIMAASLFLINYIVYLLRKNFYYNYMDKKVIVACKEKSL